ncbi:MAG: hypothetical protein R6U19_06350 [Bacteroidales bacterium]
MRNSSNIVGLIMIPLMALLIHNRFANGHFHQLANGEVIYHYHPYDKSETSSETNPISGHHHNALDLSIIAMIAGGAFFFGFIFIFHGFILTRHLHKFGRFLTHLFNRLKVRYADPRAPPFYL